MSFFRRFILPSLSLAEHPDRLGEEFEEGTPHSLRVSGATGGWTSWLRKILFVVPQRNTSYRVFLSTLMIGVLAVSAMVFLPVKPARADPHAMFYTAIGQRQLFFNVLAALDQADYVEPKAERDRLLEKRTATELFSPEDNEAVKSTRTELAALLTRGVTLEGDDLWTAFQKSSFAIETRRRVNSDKLLRKYCEVGLGISGCRQPNDDDDISKEEKAANLKKAENLKKKAYIVDPYERQGEPYLLGANAVLSSDSRPGSADQIRRTDKREDLSKKSALVRPEAYSDTIAKLRSNAGNNVLKQRAVNSATTAVKNALTSSGIDPNVFDEIDIDPETQKASLKKIEGESPHLRTLRYISALSSMLDLPGDLMLEASRGAQEIATFQEIEEEQGAIANSNFTPAIEGQTIKEFRGRITTPAHAKVALVQEGLGAIANAEQNLKWARPEAQAEAGDKEAVDTDAANNLPQNPNPVQGARTSVTANNGRSSNPQVLGFHLGIWNWLTGLGSSILSLFEDNVYRDYEKELKPLDPSKTNLVAVHEEEGALDFLKAISPEKSGGAGTSWLSILRDFGQNIINNINQE